MVLHVIRALFLLLLAAVGWAFLRVGSLTIAMALALGLLFIGIDVMAPRKKLAIFAGTFFGLMVGIAISFALSFVVTLLVNVSEPLSRPMTGAERNAIINFVQMVVGVICCYLTISFVLQTKDDFRFIIPYVEFSKQTKGARPILLDTSVLIDGRINDIASAGILESQLVVPRFVLEELQAVADSPDKLKRNRGRRGLDVLGKLQSNKRVEVILFTARRDPNEDRPRDAGAGDAGGAAGGAAGGDLADVDARLMDLAKELNARVLTNDYNLNKVAQLRGVDVVNLNDLANALKPVVLPGERMRVRLVKPGEESGQGVGYLEDGTMVVVEHARNRINEEVEFLVTSALQTSAGRMIFGRLSDGAGGGSAGHATGASAAGTSPAAAAADVDVPRRGRRGTDAPSTAS